MKILSYKLFENKITNINTEEYLSDIKIVKDVEFTTEDIQLVKDNSDIFNISFEIELESNDKDKNNNPFKFNTIQELKKNIKDLYFKKNGRNIEETTEISENKIAYESFLNKLFIKKDNIVEAIFDFDPNEVPAETKISLLIRPLITTKYFKNNTVASDLLIEEIEQNFPNFYNKYKDIIKLTNDNTLVTGGVEIIINEKNVYLNSLDESIEFLKVFYQDYLTINKRFFFTDRTGVHINISLKEKDINDYNVIKGLLFLNDIPSDDFIPTVFIGNINRMNSNWCRSVKKELFDYLKYKKELSEIPPGKVKRYNDLNKKNIVSDLKNFLFDDFDIKKIENKFNKILFEFVNIYGKKQLGFNIYNLKVNDYVEFRYSGQDISQEVLISKLYYYCYICYIMTNKNFKKKEYIEKLIEFANEIKQKI